MPTAVMHFHPPMTKKAATVISHSLSETTAMPCRSYGLPIAACKVGSILAGIEGTICSECYAGKNCYTLFPAVLHAQHKRLESLDDPLWVDALVAQIGSDPFFRWHDSGDLQSLHHLNRIVEVCMRTPNTMHWLPTREKLIVEQGLYKYGPLPDNLVVRMSAVYFDAKANPIKGIDTTSGSHKDQPPLGFECRKPYQNNTCGDCRACWDKEVKHISYAAH